LKWKKTANATFVFGVTPPRPYGARRQNSAACPSPGYAMDSGAALKTYAFDFMFQLTDEEWNIKGRNLRPLKMSRARAP